jgi:hypothetical protein
MASLNDFEAPAEVFIAHSPEEWIGVQVVGGDVEGQMRVRVLWTNGIPGVVEGEDIMVASDVLAHETMSVRGLIDARSV